MSVVSSIKRGSGEGIRATSKEGMIQEVMSREIFLCCK